MNIYVGNLPFSTTEQELKEMFEQYGQVDSVNIIMDRETNRPRGFGFVEMSDADAASKAIEATNNSDLMGRTLRVNEAKPRAERSERRPPRRGGFSPNGNY